MNGELIFEIFIFLVASCLIVPVARRFKLSAVIGYLFAGIVVGPACFGFITDAEKVMHFAEFGIIMMLFIIGLELEPSTLWRLRKSIIGIGGFQIILTTSAFTLIGLKLGLDWQASLVIALALSLSSTALVLNLLQEKNLLNSKIGETSFAVLLFQDIAVIPILILIPFLTKSGSTNATVTKSLISNLPALAQASIVAGVILALIVIGRYFSRYLFLAVAKSNLRELFTALSLSLIIGITLLMKLIGISPALGAFIAGVVLANSEYRRSLITDIQPFKGLLLGLFFISVGMGMDFILLRYQPVKILAAVFVLMFVKAVILWLIGRAFRISNTNSLGYAVTLCQGGEFAFVLFQFGGNLGVIENKEVKFLTLVVALSIAITPFVISFFNFVIDKYFKASLVEDEFDEIDQKNSIILAGFGRFGQVIGRFLMVEGFKVTVLEKDPDQIELLRKFGYKAYYGDATRSDFLRSANADKAKLLIIAVDDVQNSLAIAQMAKEEFPSLTVFARAHNRQHAYDLHKLGVDYFKRELFDSSLAMAEDIVVWLGKNKDEVNLKAKKFKCHDEQSLKHSFQFFEDEPAVINFAKTRRAELERILQSDNVEKDL
ncbi:MAG: potassium transporter [Rickettsiaceae bacterium]|jgi:monovalent cation:proton antiporter-2 (CPA2) family protein|nr:potassium transporter [Rickettsiaceae bacterium]